MGGRYLVTGGAGFIGSHLVDFILEKGHQVVILDALSWGSNMDNLPAGIKVAGGLHSQRVRSLPDCDCVLVVGDVADAALVRELVNDVDGCFHLAAQTHVDRSYGDVLPFVNSNMIGAYSVLEAFRDHPDKRLLFMSTDEVYGDKAEGFSKETDPIAPRNVYSTLKAGGDILAQTYAKVFGLNLSIARPANNYGPRQFEEKLIPKILSVVGKSKIPIYGNGGQIRDWLNVKDTTQALWTIFQNGGRGEIYNVGAHQFKTVLEVVQQILLRLGFRWQNEVEYVPDRIHGDQRYALDNSKIEALGWKATKDFIEGLNETISWQLLHRLKERQEKSSSTCGK